MKHEEQLREVKKNNTILEKKLEHERFVKSLHTSKKNKIIDFRTLNQFFQCQRHFFFHVGFVLSLKLYFVIFCDI